MADCIICEKLKEKKAFILYEDENFVAILPNKPATPGHIKIMPKHHFSKLDEMDEELVEEFFFAASFSSAAVFETFKAHGSNIIMNETAEHIAIDVLPRKENDGMNFAWKPRQQSPEEMDDVLGKIKDTAFGIGKQEEKKAPLAQTAAAEPAKEKIIKSKDDDKEENYMIRHLRKIP